VRGDVVVVDEEGEAERMEREGEKAVRRRRRDVLELRRGVKDWKRFGRLGEDILAVDSLLAIVEVMVMVMVVIWWKPIASFQARTFP
jgi:hypothetical protein